MKHISRTEYSLRNVFVGFVGYGVNFLLGFGCRMIFVRFLSEEYLGINSLFSNILAMLSLTELGIGTAMTYALYNPVAKGDTDKIASLMNFYKRAYRIVGLTIGVVGLCVMPFLSDIIRKTPDIPENLYVIYILYLFSTASSYFFSYRGALVAAHQRNYVLAGIGYAVVIVQEILQMIALFTTGSYMFYLVIQIVCGFVSNWIISWKAKIDYPYICRKNTASLPKNEVRELFCNIKALTVTKLAGVLVNSTDNIVITFFKGLAVTGAASNYTLLTGLLSSLLGQLFNGLSASIGNLNAIGSKEDKYNFFSILNLTNFWLFGWAAVGIFVTSSDIVQLCFGEKYVLHWSIPLILAVNFYMVGIQNAVWIYRSTLGLFKRGQYLLIVTALLNIIGDIILGHCFGLFGIYLATAISRLLTNTWYDPYAVFKYGLNKNPCIYLARFIEYAVLLVGVTIVCLLICVPIKLSLPLQIIIKVIVCTLVPNGVFYLVFRNTKEFKYLSRKAGLLLKKSNRFKEKM